MVNCSISVFARYDLSLLKGLVLDIDGVLYEGDQALPGAVELINHLNRKKTAYTLLSNNSTQRIREHKSKLDDFGMHVAIEKIITGAIITSKVLSTEAQKGSRCLVVGEEGLVEALEWAGFEVTRNDYHDISYVVVGMDRTFNYEKLLTASRAIQRGAQLISSNPDPVYPAGNELIPASGAIQAAIEISSGCKARVTGKPETYGYHLALQKLGLPAEKVGMVGDQPKTDHLGAKQVGMKCLLIFSSLTNKLSLESSPVQVDGIYESTLDFYNDWIRQTKN